MQQNLVFQERGNCFADISLKIIFDTAGHLVFFSEGHFDLGAVLAAVLDPAVQRVYVRRVLGRPVDRLQHLGGQCYDFVNSFVNFDQNLAFFKSSNTAGLGK
jgi:hypothetical protein